MVLGIRLMRINGAYDPRSNHIHPCLHSNDAYSSSVPVRKGTKGVDEHWGDGGRSVGWQGGSAWGAEEDLLDVVEI